MESADYHGSLKKADDLRQRTKKFAIRVVNLFARCRALPTLKHSESKFFVLAPQWQQIIVQSAEHVRSQNSFRGWGLSSKEADETVFWLEVLTETGVISATKAADLQKEAKELLATLSASLRTAKRDLQ